MVKHLLFKNRDGQTPLTEEQYKGLKPKNIQTMGELDEYEEENMVEGDMWLSQKEGNCFDYGLWLKIHKKFFGDVWDWAGELRKNELNNACFLEYSKIASELMKLSKDVECWITQNSYPQKEAIARLHERLLTIHPFPNGNGRWSRILTEYICRCNGIEFPKWKISMKADKDMRRKTYIQAIDEARHNKNFDPLIDFIFN